LGNVARFARDVSAATPFRSSNARRAIRFRAWPSDREGVHFGQTEKPKKIQWRGNFVEDVLHATLHISPIAMVTIPAAKNLELSRPGAQHF